MSYIEIHSFSAKDTYAHYVNDQFVIYEKGSKIVSEAIDMNDVDKILCEQNRKGDELYQGSSNFGVYNLIHVIREIVDVVVSTRKKEFDLVNFAVKFKDGRSLAGTCERKTYREMSSRFTDIKFS